MFQRALPYILDDPTTVDWFVGRSEKDPATFVLSHTFTSEEARSAHFGGPAAPLISANQPLRSFRRTSRSAPVGGPAATLIMSEGGPPFAAEPEIKDFSVLAGTANGG